MKLDKTTKRILRDPGKRRAWVLYQLTLRGENLVTIAREWNVSRQCVRQALVKPYPKFERIIAEHLGLTPQQLFPDRYDRDGLPLRGAGPGKKRRPVSCPGKNNTDPETGDVRRTEAA